MDRFFLRLSYAEIAERHDMTQEAAKKTFSNALRRVGAVVAALDDPTSSRNLESWHKRVVDRSGAFPKGVRYFLLNKLLGFRPSEICELEGLPPNSASVRSAIARVADQLSAGELKLWEPSPEEAQAAKARLDAQRAKRRARHSKKSADTV